MLMGEFQAHCWITDHCGAVFEQMDPFSAPQIEFMQGSWALSPTPHLPSTYSLAFEHQFWNSAAWVQIQVLELTEDRC